MDGFINWIDLLIKVLNYIAIWGWGIYISYQLTLLAFWPWDDQMQKRRKDSAKTSAFYIWLSLVIINVLFWALEQFGFFDMADESKTKVTNFLQKWVDEMESGNYNAPLGGDSDNDYKNSGWWEAINLR